MSNLLAEIEAFNRTAEHLHQLRETFFSSRIVNKHLNLLPGDEEIIERCDGSLHEFVQDFWPILEPRTQFVDGMPIQAMCEHLEAVSHGQIQHLLMNIPPGFMKSLLTCVFWPAWEWGPANLGHLRYVAFSYTGSLTRRDNAKFRDLITSEKYVRLYGDRYSLRKKGEIKVLNSLTGFKLATSVKGVGTGERGDRLLWDDLHNVKEGESKKIREKTVDAVRTTLLNRLNDMAKSSIVAVQQRVNEEDASAAMINPAYGMEFVHLNIPNEFEPQYRCITPIWRDPRTKKGELAFPERLDAAETMKMRKKLGSYAYSGQYQQRPTPAGGGIIKERDFRIWVQADEHTKEIIFPKFDFIVASLDSAYTEKDENNPSGFTVWGVFRDHITRQPQIMLLYAARAHLRTLALVKRIAPLCKQMSVDLLLIENKANGKDVADMLGRLFRTHIPTQLVEPHGDKVARLYSVQHIFEDGMVWRLNRPSGLMVQDEICRQPKSDLWDLTDSTTQCLKWLRTNNWVLSTDEGTGEMDPHRYGRQQAMEDEVIYDV